MVYSLGLISHSGKAASSCTKRTARRRNDLPEPVNVIKSEKHDPEHGVEVISAEILKIK